MNLKIISAGAGSGKTYRLTQEMVALLNPENPNRVRPSGIIATTFTSKAAAELQERVRTKLLEEGLIREADELTNALIGTVHGLGVKLLKRFAFEAGVSPEVDIIADEDQQLMFNQSLAAVLSPERIAEMVQLSERLGLTKKDTTYDWRKEVKNLTDIARSNAMDLATLEKSKQLSLSTFFELLNETPAPDGEALNAELLETLKQTIERLQNNEDSTKTTKDVINNLRQLVNKMTNKGRLEWHEWVKAGKDAQGVGKKSRDDAAELIEVAQKVEQHPDFQQDIRQFITRLFDLSILAIEEYEQYKKRRGLIDYIDMEISVKRLLDDETVRSVLSEEVDLLMVDEFQDTSPIQLEIFWKLSQFAKYSIWVGDPKQSIYGFRGADPELMQAIIAKTGGVKPEDIQRFSWRSRADLVHTVNAIFVRAFHDLPREQIALEPAPPKLKSKEPFELDNALIHWYFEKDTPGKRAPKAPWVENCIAESIKTQLLERGVQVQPKSGGGVRAVRAGDIAVLCRSNKECLAMAQALHRVGLKAAIARNGLLKTAEARLILACLKFVLNRADSLAVSEILLLASQKNTEAIIESRLAFLETAPKRYDDWATDDDFIQKLHDLRREVAELSSTEILNMVIEALDLRRVIAGWGSLEQRFANIDAIRRYALQYEENCNRLHTAASLSGFLLWLSDLAVSDADNQGSGTSEDAVNVLTYHKSKGLEWPVVICHSLEDKLRDEVWGVSIVPEKDDIDLNDILGNRWLRYWINPFQDQIGKTKLEQKINDSAAKKKATKMALAEGGRLLYVGLTRARDYLILPSRQFKHTKWLNRTWFNGKEDTPTLDPYLAGNGETGTYESPWFWNDQNIPLDTCVQVFSENFAYQELLPQPIDYIEQKGKKQVFLPFDIDPEKEDLKKFFPIKNYREARYTDPIRLTEEAEKGVIGKLIRAYLAADDPQQATDKRLEKATLLIENFKATEMLDARSLLGLSQRFFQYLQDNFQPKTLDRQLPVSYLWRGRLFKTEMDLVATLPDGRLLLLQGLDFSGSNKDWKRRAKAQANSLSLAAAALQSQRNDTPSVLLGVHFFTVGGLAFFEI